MESTINGLIHTLFIQLKKRLMFIFLSQFLLESNIKIAIFSLVSLFHVTHAWTPFSYAAKISKIVGNPSCESENFYSLSTTVWIFSRSRNISFSKCYYEHSRHFSSVVKNKLNCTQAYFRLRSLVQSMSSNKRSFPTAAISLAVDTEKASIEWSLHHCCAN